MKQRSVSKHVDCLIDNQIPFIINVNNCNNGCHSHYFIINFKKVFPRNSSIISANDGTIHYLQLRININDINLSDYLMFKINDKFVFLKTSSNRNLLLKSQIGKSKIYRQRKLTNKFIVIIINMNEFVKYSLSIPQFKEELDIEEL